MLKGKITIQIHPNVSKKQAIPSSEGKKNLLELQYYCAVSLLLVNQNHNTKQRTRRAAGLFAFDIEINSSWPRL